jgi:hypothetical protein
VTALATKTQVDLILDSGAYSAWKKRESLTVDQYAEFINKHKSSLAHYVNLDRIPGEWGRVPSPSEVEASAQIGMENLLKLRKLGLLAMPVFHQGERLYWLEKMIDEGYSYIGISPANDRTTEQKQDWLDEIFGFLCGSRGYPHIKTHGFGVTALPLLFRYPWYSADSVTWLLVGGYGGILVPRTDVNGKHDYTVSPLVVQVSQRTNGRPSAASLEPGKHFMSMGEASQKHILKYVEDEGFSMEKLKSEYLARQRVNCRFFKKAGQTYVPKPFVRQKRTLSNLFGSTSVTNFGSASNPWGNLKIVFTLTTSPEHSDILEDEGVRERLLTYYYFLKGEAPFDIEDYVRTGRIDKSKKQLKRRSKAAKAAISDDDEED